MIKSIKAILAQDKEKFKVPRKVQDLIPIKNIWPDGIFKVGNKFSKSFRFSDINYLVASREDKESMFLTYSELLNSLDSGATTKITINNHRLNRSDFEESILMPMKQDGLDEYRKEYNDMLLDKATGANGITQEKYITITVAKKDIEEARAYFARIGADLTAHFANLGSKCVPLNAVERLRILHDFYRPGDEAAFSFDMNRKARLGHDFRDYICPDSIERAADHIKLGEKYARVLFLKDYASYIKDSMFSELTELNRNLMTETAISLRKKRRRRLRRSILLSATRRRMRWLRSTASMRIKSSSLQNCLRRTAACGRRCFTESMEWMTKSLPWRCRRWAMWAESPIGHGTASAAAWSGAPASSAGARTNAAISTPVSFPSSPDVSTVYSGSGSVDSGRITPWSPRPA